MVGGQVWRPMQGSGTHPCRHRPNRHTFLALAQFLCVLTDPRTPLRARARPVRLPARTHQVSIGEPLGVRLLAHCCSGHPFTSLHSCGCCRKDSLHHWTGQLRSAQEADTTRVSDYRLGNCSSAAMQDHNEHQSGPSCWPLSPGLILNAPAYLHRLGHRASGPAGTAVQTWQLLSARQPRWLPEESHHSSSTDLPSVEPAQQERTSSQSSAMHRRPGNGPEPAPPRGTEEADAASELEVGGYAPRVLSKLEQQIEEIRNDLRVTQRLQLHSGVQWLSDLGLSYEAATRGTQPPPSSWQASPGLRFLPYAEEGRSPLARGGRDAAIMPPPPLPQAQSYAPAQSHSLDPTIPTWLLARAPYQNLQQQLPPWTPSGWEDDSSAALEDETAAAVLVGMSRSDPTKRRSEPTGASSPGPSPTMSKRRRSSAPGIQAEPSQATAQPSARTLPPIKSQGNARPSGSRRRKAVVRHSGEQRDLLRYAKNTVSRQTIREVFGEEASFPVRCNLRIEVDGEMRWVAG
jgi:hypothetical protein